MGCAGFAAGFGATGFGGASGRVAGPVPASDLAGTTSENRAVPMRCDEYDRLMLLRLSVGLRMSRYANPQAGTSMRLIGTHRLSVRLMSARREEIVVRNLIEQHATKCEACRDVVRDSDGLAAGELK